MNRDRGEKEHYPCFTDGELKMERLNDLPKETPEVWSPVLVIQMQIKSDILSKVLVFKTD